MVDSKIDPPSASRIEQARSLGSAPRPVLVGLAGGFAALALCLAFWGPTLVRGLSVLLRAPLEAFAEGKPERAWRLVLPALRTLAVHALLISIACFVASALALFVAQGPSFGWPGRGRGQFSEPEPVRGLTLLAGLVLLVVLASLLREALWVEPAGVSTLFGRLFTRVGLALCALAVIDAAFARAAFFRALWLTRREQRDEQREAYGSPEIRATRARIRRESTQGGV